MPGCLRHLAEGPAIERPSVQALPDATPLLEEERDAGALALPLDLPHPLRAHLPRPGPALPAAAHRASFAHRCAGNGDRLGYCPRADRHDTFGAVPTSPPAPGACVTHPDPDLVSVRRPEGRTLPIIASFPHSGLHVPRDIADLFTPEHRAWLRNTDWYLPELYDFLPELGVTMVVATHSRYVVDLNRDPAGPLYGDFFRAVIARSAADGAPIYATPDAPRDHAAAVATYHAPYHAAMRQALDGALATSGRALLLDLHSFMGPTEHDICIGDCRGSSCLPSTTDAFALALRSHGFDVSRNEPFPGGFITRQYGRPPRCEALQIELRYPVYLDCARIDEPGRPALDGARVSAARRRLRPAVEQAITALTAI